MSVESIEVSLSLPLPQSSRVQLTRLIEQIVGQKAIVEAYGTSTQLNGKPYHNKYVPSTSSQSIAEVLTAPFRSYCWILYVSEETGKIFKITEYMNTALVKEVLAAEPA